MGIMLMKFIKWLCLVILANDYIAYIELANEFIKLLLHLITLLKQDIKTCSLTDIIKQRHIFLEVVEFFQSKAFKKRFLFF
jgi:hypothetical protein